MEVSLLDQPLVDADGTLHRLGPMVGHNDDRRVIVKLSQHLADLAVQEAVVDTDSVPVGVPGLVAAVSVVEVLPEAVVDAVQAYFYHHSEVPGPGLQEVAKELEALDSHLSRLA